MIEASNLTKRYGDATVVKGQSFTVVPGQVTGFSAPTAAARRRRCA